MHRRISSIRRTYWRNNSNS